MRMCEYERSPEEARQLACSIQRWRLFANGACRPPYDVVLDRNGEVRIGSVRSDRVAPFNFQIGEFVEYLLLRETNIH